MSSLTDMKISAQVKGGFGVLLLLLMVLGGTSWFALSRVGESFAEYLRLSKLGDEVQGAEESMFKARLGEATYLRTRAEDDKNRTEGELNEVRNRIDAALALVVAPERRREIESMRTGFQQFSGAFEKLGEQMRALTAAEEAILKGTGQIAEVFGRVQTIANGTRDDESMQFADRSMNGIQLARIGLTRYLTTAAESDIDMAFARFDDVARALSALTARRPQDRALADAVAVAQSQHASLLEKARHYKQVHADTRRIEDQMIGYARSITSYSGNVVASLATAQHTVGEGARDAVENARGVMLSVGLSALLVGAFAAFFISRRIAVPLNRVATVIGEITATKDLTKRVDYVSTNEIGQISSGFNGLMKELQEAFQGVGQNTSQVAAAAGQASTAVGQVSDGSQNQLNAINQISAAMEQTTKAINDVASSSDTATANAKTAAEMVQHGREKMTLMVEVANVISDNSKKINQITDVISRIANQTNMLSLNAAIEAARAGEHGKGFAVVAEEVRKLAEHAANSVQQITELVEHASREAQRSVEMVGAVNGDMEAIAESVRQTDGVMQSIAAAMTQQASSVEEINANIKNLSKIGETNATAAEEITATMVELARLADQTRRQMQQFNI